MAMGFFKHLAGDRATVYSGGSEPAEDVNPAAIAAMAEKGIDIATEHPKRWTMDMLEAVDVVMTMGCGDSCPILPGRRYEDWVLPDPPANRLKRYARSVTRSKVAWRRCWTNWHMHGTPLNTPNRLPKLMTSPVSLWAPSVNLAELAYRSDTATWAEASRFEPMHSYL